MSVPPHNHMRKNRTCAAMPSPSSFYSTAATGAPFYGDDGESLASFMGGGGHTAAGYPRSMSSTINYPSYVSTNAPFGSRCNDDEDCGDNGDGGYTGRGGMPTTQAGYTSRCSCRACTGERDTTTSTGSRFRSSSRSRSDTATASEFPKPVFSSMSTGGGGGTARTSSHAVYGDYY